MNNNVLNGFSHINLQGIAIGNGWVHPILQNKAYVDYSYNLGAHNIYLFWLFIF